MTDFHQKCGVQRADFVWNKKNPTPIACLTCLCSFRCFILWESSQKQHYQTGSGAFWLEIQTPRQISPGMNLCFMISFNSSLSLSLSLYIYITASVAWDGQGQWCKLLLCLITAKTKTWRMDGRTDFATKSVFRCVHASLYEDLSVGPSVVCRSVVRCALFLNRGNW